MAARSLLLAVTFALTLAGTAVGQTVHLPREDSSRVGVTGYVPPPLRAPGLRADAAATRDKSAEPVAGSPRRK